MDSLRPLERQQLNPIDFIHRLYPTIVVFKYDGHVDVEKVRSYFENLKRKFPQISSTYSTEGNFGYLNYHDDPLNFTTSTIEHEPQLDAFTDQPSTQNINDEILTRIQELKRLYLHLMAILLFTLPKCYSPKSPTLQSLFHTEFVMLKE